MTSSTPDRPRATSDRRNPVQADGGLGGDDVEPDDLPATLHVHRRGDHRRHVDDPAALAHLLGQRVDPQVAVGASVQRSFAELGHLGVELAGQPRHLRLARSRRCPSPRRDPPPVGWRRLRRRPGRSPTPTPARLGDDAPAATPGSSEPSRSLGTFRSIVPTRVSQRRSR